MSLLSLHSAQETRRLGEILASCLYPGLLVCLDGDLGAGKSTLAQGFGEALGIPRMASPSFVLLREYPTRPPLVHGDLYRLSQEEALDLHLEEYLGEGWVVLLEWACRLDREPFPDRWEVSLHAPFLEEEAPEELRILRAGGVSERSRSVLEAALDRFAREQTKRRTRP